MDNNTEEISRMMSLIMESSHPMPNYVFNHYITSNQKSETKILYNLIADSFLTLYSYCHLIFDHAWSQAFALLRTGIEQVSAVYILTSIPDSLAKYIDLYNLKAQYYRLESEEEEKVFLKDHKIPKNKVNEYFDYSWISSFVEGAKYGRDEMIELAQLGELIPDIKNTLNAFSHGSLSVFQLSGDNWEVMRRQGRRGNLACCKLYDFLCCSYHNLIGDDEFSKLPLNDYFIAFKTLFHDYLVKRGWMKEEE